MAELTRLHDWRTKSLEDNNADENTESKTNELGASPRQSMRSRV
jgi:hypothetical protein